jgi:glycolate oxidase FAD binding subunit
VTVEEIQAAVREAVRARGTVAARGFGTYGGDVPNGVRVLDMRGLDRILEYDPADLTVTVQAGCPVGVLDAALAEHGQWLPVNVPWPERTTVGGMIAMGLVGPLRRTYGTLRDQVIGIEWVGGEGQVLRSGGRVVKNVAGYDLMKVHVGARGRFGVLTQATFRVRPRVERMTPAAGNEAGAGPPRATVGPALARLREGLLHAFDAGGVFRR